jgi:hypothetical protein
MIIFESQIAKLPLWWAAKTTLLTESIYYFLFP